jgi:hypothetical protein
VAVLVAFGVCAFTTGVGVVLATWAGTDTVGLNSFGYTAVDQVLLPFTTIPLAWLIDSWGFARRIVGEPDADADSASASAAAVGIKPAGTQRSFLTTLRRTWWEMCNPPQPFPTPHASESLAPASAPSPASGSACMSRLTQWLHTPMRAWFTLLPFHGLEFIRTLLFFYLVNAFDTESTYFAMTILRVVLCWLASIVACTSLQGWVGLRDSEVSTTMHPANLLLKLAGSSVLIGSIVLLRDEGGASRRML